MVTAPGGLRVVSLRPDVTLGRRVAAPIRFLAGARPIGGEHGWPQEGCARARSAGRQPLACHRDGPGRHSPLRLGPPRAWTRDRYHGSPGRTLFSFHLVGRHGTWGRARLRALRHGGLASVRRDLRQGSGRHRAGVAGFRRRRRGCRFPHRWARGLGTRLVLSGEQAGGATAGRPRTSGAAFGGTHVRCPPGLGLAAQFGPRWPQTVLGRTCARGVLSGGDRPRERALLSGDGGTSADPLRPGSSSRQHIGNPEDARRDVEVHLGPRDPDRASPYDLPPSDAHHAFPEYLRPGGTEFALAGCWKHAPHTGGSPLGHLSGDRSGGGSGTGPPCGGLCRTYRAENGRAHAGGIGSGLGLYRSISHSVVVP